MAAKGLNNTKDSNDNSSEKKSLRLAFFQPKLTVNQPNDVYEQEADHMADKVMRMADPSVNQQAFFKPAYTHIQRKCQACEEEDKFVHRKENSQSETDSTGLDSYVSSLGSSGQSLPASSRQFFEPKFGHDFSNVKIHTDSVAAKSAQSISALAYTSGNNIVFNSGQYSPDSDSGKRLMAHELTHVVQQGRGQKLQRAIQRQTIKLDSGRIVGAAPADNIKEDVLEVIDSLHLATNLNNADYSAELPAVTAISPLTTVPQATIPKTIAAIADYEQPVLSKQTAQSVFGIVLNNDVGKWMANAKADVGIMQDFLHTQSFLKNVDYNTETSNVKAGTDPVKESSINQTLVALASLKLSKLAQGSAPHDIMAGTHAVTSDQRSKAEAAMIPGASSSGGKTSVPSPDPICAKLPDLEKEIRGVIELYIHDTATDFSARKKQSPVLPVPQMNSMADVVQEELQKYFGSYLLGATHLSESKFTAGAFDVKGKLKDQSQSVQWQTPGGRKSWVNYWISEQMKSTDHHCINNEIDTVAEHIANDATLIPDIDITVQSWPAEATGGININPYIRDANASNDEKRKGRWDAFTTIMHEALHLLVHPNFVKTYSQMIDTTKQILKEGFNDMFREELWSGPGNLVNRVGFASYDPKRAIIEGAPYPYDASLVYYHDDYDEISNAIKVRDAVGVENVKAAYFLGHTELLGLGTGSHGVTPTGKLDATAMYQTTDPADESAVNTLAGEKYDALIKRLNAPSGSIADAATGNAVPVGSAALPPKVKVAGIKHITAINGDTIETIAHQNGVTSANLMRANNLTNKIITTGQHIIIPLHSNPALNTTLPGIKLDDFNTPDAKIIDNGTNARLNLSVHIDFLPQHTFLHVFAAKQQGGDEDASTPVQLIGEPGKGGDYNVILSPVPQGYFIMFEARSTTTKISIPNIVGKYTVNK
ncbi:eCIS core domain-containing protein [Mucilaginibacter sp. X4EP1]|uniref:eCIS core domain-containing protein n=1 Tax=Mucilaginibacter sp. X4EP1 TaxID=2723092 RepID=UPI002167394D|nr:DUF4157 domain-containing protein [Mucilaginibacter sp. X4EP1]MCS3816021.1 LysM repeat protein [Mucilaginibacter sp. X4EP1]